MRFYDRRRHLEYRFVLEKQTPFGHSKHFAREPESSEVIQKLPREQPRGVEVFEVVGRELHRFQKVEYTFETGTDEIAPVGWILTDKEAEGSRLEHLFAKINFRHCEFVKIS